MILIFFFFFFTNYVAEFGSVFFIADDTNKPKPLKNTEEFWQSSTDIRLFWQWHESEEAQWMNAALFWNAAKWMRDWNYLIDDPPELNNIFKSCVNA